MTLQLDHGKLKDLIFDLNDADNVQSVRQIFFRISAAFGFKCATLIILPARTDKEISELVLETNMPEGFFARFDSMGGADGHIVFDMLRQSISPVTWTLDGMSQKYANLGRDVPQCYDLYREIGINMGVAIPLTTVDGSRHVVAYHGVGEALASHDFNELVVLTIRMFDAYHKARSTTVGQSATLTARELEVVRWTAAGKTSSEIGRIMDLSDHTINAYLNNAFKKLDCVSRTQLVAKALRLRVIS